MPWTAEELEAIRISDEEIERSGLTYEDYKAARSLDEYITGETRADKMRKAYQREYYKANKDKLKAYQREYYKAMYTTPIRKITRIWRRTLWAQ